MTNGITIIGREWIIDPTVKGGQKEVAVYGVISSSLIDNILSVYPHTGDGSFAICLPEGVCKMLIDGHWV
jgi:hypothetical protein